MIRILPIACLFVFLLGCNYEDDVNDRIYSEVYAPVYESEEVARSISIQNAFTITNPAKIWLYKDYLIVNIKDEGMHVIDNSNPEFPRQLFFISIPGNQDIAVKNDIFYADNYGDIVAFQINEDLSLNIVERLSNVMQNQLYPPHENVGFECVDTSRGVVIDWVRIDNQNVNCYR